MRGIPPSIPPVGPDVWRDTTVGNTLHHIVGVDGWAFVTINNATTLAADKLVLLPCSFPVALTIPNLSTKGTFNDAARSQGIGIYAADGTLGRPNTLLAQVNSIAQINDWRNHAFNYAVVAGTKLWIGLVTQAGGACNMSFVAASMAGGIGYPATAFTGGAAIPACGLTAAHVYVPGNGMPSPCPAVSLYYGEAGKIPAITINGF